MLLASSQINMNQNNGCNQTMDVTKQWDTMQSTDFIVSVIPELYLKLKRPELKDKIGKILQVIIEFTQGILSAKEWHRLAWTMQVMNYTYIRGDLEVQSKIKTIFIAAFEDFKRVCSPNEWTLIEKKLPIILRNEHRLMQVNKKDEQFKN